MKITLTQLKSMHACRDGIVWFKKQKNKEAKHILRQCVKKAHSNYANWLVCSLFTHDQLVTYSIYNAEPCLHKYETMYPSLAPRQAIEAAKRWLQDPSEANKVAASAAARLAMFAARTAYSMGLASAAKAAELASITASAAAWSAVFAARTAYSIGLASAATWSASAARIAESTAIEKAIEILGL
jgi:hypothetical protein